MQQFFNLPRPVLIVMGVLTATSITGALAAIDYRLAAIVFTGMLFVGAAVWLFIAIRDWMNRRRASTLAGDLQQHSGAAPTGINDPGQRARLDELRRTFGEGLAKFGGVQNVYKFPWYLIVGEPGSGKTEAVRHCNVGFPPGLQNELQGVGGTINMNWWFTNHAVFLDTAGRLMFEEVHAGETNEWREFLNLLKRNRPNCPINGLLLIIPADSLIKDSEEEINRKAGKISQQFDVVQRALDIRFPVFILVTKCDLLSGFREFFDDFSDAQSQHQMIGWSNRDERDAPFRPDMVADYIGTVVKRIEKRRLSLLRDPIPQKGEERRTNEVDALYGLPQSFGLIAPRLRSYLEKIFIAGPWSPKPLFLRGIYFTSSMREGSALDQELAQALGLRADELRESRQWERERAYFLRDLFTEKVFRERGLVTRATNTRKMLRTRSVVLWGTGIALALLFIGSSFYFFHQLEESINSQAKYWAAAKVWDRPGLWKPVVEPRGDAKAAAYKGDEAVAATGDNVTRLAFHQTLKDLAAQELNTGWAFKPMLRWVRVDGDRKLAQRIVFEGGVVKPVVDTARQRMKSEDIKDAADHDLSTAARLLREANALAALIRIESDALTKRGLMDTLSKDTMEPLVIYGTTQEHALDEKSELLLATEMNQTYASSFRDRSKGAWPPPWLPIGAATLSANEPIYKGLDRLHKLAEESVQSQVDRLEEVRALRDDLRRFREKENQMDATVASADPEQKRAETLEALLAELGSLKTAIAKKLADGQQHGLFAGGVSLKSSYDRYVGDSQSGFESAFKVTKAAAQPQLANKENQLFKEVDEKLDQFKGDLRDKAANVFKEDEVKELALLDPYLLDFGNGQRVYEVRWNSYEMAHQQAVKNDQFGNLIGTGWASFASITNEIAAARRQIEATRQKLTEPFAAPCLFLLTRAQTTRPYRVALTYLRQSASRFDGDFFSPFVRTNSKGPKESTRSRALRDMQDWQGDFKAEPYQKIDPSVRTKLDRFNGELEKMKAYVSALESSFVEVTYSPGDNKDFYYKFRRIRFGGGGEKASDLESASGRYRYGETVSIACIDYSSGAQKLVPLSLNSASLLHDHNIEIGGVTLHLGVKAEGNPPNPRDQPDKNDVLRILQ